MVQLFCGHEPTRLRGIRARLTSPVYPGETLVFEGWRVAGGHADGEVAFRVRVKERDVVVLNNGRAQVTG